MLENTTPESIKAQLGPLFYHFAGVVGGNAIASPDPRPAPAMPKRARGLRGLFSKG